MMITDKKGFFDRKILDSRIHSENTALKERVFRYLLGPVGALFLNAIMGTYINLYYTDVLKLTAIGGGAPSGFRHIAVCGSGCKPDCAADLGGAVLQFLLCHFRHDLLYEP